MIPFIHIFAVCCQNSKISSPVFFNSGEISASLNLDGKVAWVKDKFAKCEMRMEEVPAHDFRSEVGM